MNEVVTSHNEVDSLVRCFHENAQSHDLMPDWINRGSDEELWECVLRNAPELCLGSDNRRFAQKKEDESFRRREHPYVAERPFLRADIVRTYLSHRQMLQAEKTASEFVRSLEQWGAVVPSQVVWTFVKTLPTYIIYLGGPFDFAMDSLWESLEDQDQLPVGLDDSLFGVEGMKLPDLVRKTVQANAAWKYAVTHNLFITGPKYALAKMMARRFSELTNPFEVLVRIWMQGCFPTNIPDRDDSVLRMTIRR